MQSKKIISPKHTVGQTPNPCCHVQPQGDSVFSPHPLNCPSVHCLKFGRPPRRCSDGGAPRTQKRTRLQGRSGAAPHSSDRPTPAPGPGSGTTKPSRQLQGEEEEEVGLARGGSERGSLAPRRRTALGALLRALVRRPRQPAAASGSPNSGAARARGGTRAVPGAGRQRRDRTKTRLSALRRPRLPGP